MAAASLLWCALGGPASELDAAHNGNAKVFSDSDSWQVTHWKSAHHTTCARPEMPEHKAVRPPCAVFMSAASCYVECSGAMIKMLTVVKQGMRPSSTLAGKFHFAASPLGSSRRMANSNHRLPCGLYSHLQLAPHRQKAGIQEATNVLS